jgi:hypothetical protein
MATCNAMHLSQIIKAVVTVLFHMSACMLRVRTAIEASADIVACNFVLQSQGHDA